MDSATRKENQFNSPLFDPEGEFPTSNPTASGSGDLLAQLKSLQADIINREALIAEQERRLNAWELDLTEREGLLQAHKNLIAAQSTSNTGDGEQTDAERDALETLRRQLEAQEASIKEARQMLKEREEYIEQCENDLVEKSMELTEREAYVEQREANAGMEDR